MQEPRTEAEILAIMEELARRKPVIDPDLLKPPKIVHTEHRLSGGRTTKRRGKVTKNRSFKRNAR